MLLCLLLFACGCQKKEEEKELLPASKELFTYEVAEFTTSMAVDEKGNLYTVEYVFPEENEPVREEDFEMAMPKQRFSVYNLDGECSCQKEIELGTGFINGLYVGENALYVLSSSNGGHRVCEISLSTWEVRELASFAGYQYVTDMVYLDGYLYFLGAYTEAMNKTYALHPDVLAYTYTGEQVGRISIQEQEPQMELMQVEFPIGMYRTERDTLMVYQYTEEQGFGFLEFDPQKVTLTERGRKKTDTPLQKLGGCEEGFLFNHGYLYYGDMDGMEAQLFPEQILLKFPAVYKKGFVFFMDINEPGQVKRFCMEGLVKDNKEIRLLLYDENDELPFGCGYRMQKQVLSQDEYALKVLAQDKDFDLYLLDSNRAGAYNLKKNGAFFPLNEVEGVQEYIDACFPYVKDLAINEDGDIWMVPVTISMPGLMYHKEFCREQGIDFDQMDFLSLLSLLDEVESEQPQLTEVSMPMLIRELFRKYQSPNDNYDTELFRTTAKKFQELYQHYGWLKYGSSVLEMFVEDPKSKFYFKLSDKISNFSYYKQYFGNSDVIGVCRVPELSKGIGSVGAITFLAVNPRSENLKETLSYLSAYSKYMMTRQNSFLLRDESTYDDTPYAKEWYQLYADGSIEFAVEFDIYWNPFMDYLMENGDIDAMITEIQRRKKQYLGE